MAVPTIVGDTYGPYVRPPQAPTPFTVTVGGGSKVLFRGKPPALFLGAVTSGGTVISATLVSTKVRVESRPIILQGAVTALDSGWTGGIAVGPGPADLTVS